VVSASSVSPAACTVAIVVFAVHPDPLKAESPPTSGFLFLQNAYEKWSLDLFSLIMYAWILTLFSFGFCENVHFDRRTVTVRVISIPFLVFDGTSRDGEVKMRSEFGHR
jgi:hypothetical protein